MWGSRAYALVFGFLLVTAGAAEWSLLRSRYRATMAYWEARQSSIADDRARMVSDWLAERRADLELLSTRPSVQAVLSSDPAWKRLAGIPSKSGAGFGEVLDRVARVYGYDGAYVLDAKAQVVARSAGSVELSPSAMGIFQTVAQTGESRVDLLGDAPGKSLLSFSMPVLAQGLTRRPKRLPRSPIGVVVLVAGPARSLFPRLVAETVPTRTGETVLMRREGNDIVFFSPLRHVPAGSPNMRFPLSTVPLPARIAGEGREIFGEFRDYRGAPVLAATRRIPLTGWGLVRKIDREEALAEFYRTAWREGSAGGLLILAFAGLLIAHHRHVSTRVLKRESEKFRSLLESAPDAMVIIERHGRIVLVNAETEKVFGYGREELIGQPIEIFVPERFRARHREGCVSYFADSSTQHMGGGVELVGLRKDGSEFPIEVTLSPIETAEGLLVSSAIRDITERQRAEEAVRKSEAGLAEAQRIAHMGNWDWDIVSNELRWSDEIYRIFGLAPQSFGATYEAFLSSVHPADREVVNKSVEDALSGRKPYSIDHRIILPDGSERVVHEQAEIRYDEARKPLRMVGTVQDITERKRAEELDRFFALSMDMLCIAGFDGYFKRLNPAWREILGFSEDDLLAQPYLSFVHPEDRESTVAEAQKLVSGAVTVAFENRYKCKDGSYKWLLWNSTPLPERELIYAVARDITERKRSEEETRKLNLELMAANQELEAFTYSVSHDLRAPLRHIDGFSRLLLDEYAPELPEEARRYLTRVREGTVRMGQLVDDLLNLTRVARQELRLQLTGMNPLLEEVRSGLQADTEGREVEWKIGPLPFVECDPALMKQVFANLLSNSVKFTRPRERAVIEVGALPGDGGATVFVRDNGVGFSMKYADKLFGVFQRLHRAEDFPGTGVGLATVRRIIHKHEGRIWAESELNRGTTFYFTLGVPEGRRFENRGAGGA